MKLCIKCGFKEIDHLVFDHAYEYTPDKCQVCLGTKGGMLGNENIIESVVICDYCTSLYLEDKIDLSVYKKLEYEALV